MCAYVNVQIIHIANICNSWKDIFTEVTNLGKDRQELHPRLPNYLLYVYT